MENYEFDAFMSEYLFINYLKIFKSNFKYSIFVLTVNFI